MGTQEEIDKYLEEHRKLLSTLAEMVIKYPDPEAIDELRKMIRISGMFAMSNVPSFLEDYQGVVTDADTFLKSCQTGELDPRDFIIKDE